mmetsp:Transcript_5673/g.16755  ORF Transcript_5673/g.16755 Transcript_5673/m.16755 type:complete len:285 (+) Transcript_5673:296-1150(+)
MGGSSKLDKLKAMQKESKKGIVVDKTFGLKNKNKSKKVQKFVAQVNDEKTRANGDKEKLKKEKKMSKIARIQQEMELKALFSEALSITVKKKDLHKKKESGGSGGGGKGGAGDHYDEAWAEAELKKAQEHAPEGELTLEQRIERKRQELRDKGIKGTPVTPETFKAWKEAKAKRLLDAKMAEAKAEALKKKGKSVLSGRDLFLVQRDVFVDDAEAAGGDDLVREKEAVDELYDENGLLREEAEADVARPPPAPARAKVKLGSGAAEVNAALYGEDDVDLEDLDD